MTMGDDDDGIPPHHVMRFQLIAPTNAPSITDESTIAGFTIPPAIVFATAVVKTKAAMKLKNAAQRTAKLGERTRVETTVAMEFAAS